AVLFAGRGGITVRNGTTRTPAPRDYGSDGNCGPGSSSAGGGGAGTSVRGERPKRTVGFAETGSPTRGRTASTASFAASGTSACGSTRGKSSAGGGGAGTDEDEEALRRPTILSPASSIGCDKNGGTYGSVLSTLATCSNSGAALCN